MLVEGAAELLLCFDIVKELPIRAISGVGQFVGRLQESDMRAYNNDTTGYFPYSPNCPCVREDEWVSIERKRRGVKVSQAPGGPGRGLFR